MPAPVIRTGSTFRQGARTRVVLLLVLFACGLAGCGRFTYQPAADLPHPLWPQLGGGPTRNAAIEDEPDFPLQRVWMKRASSAIAPAIIGFDDWIVFTTKDGKIEGFHLRTGDRLGRTIGRNNTALTCAWGGEGLLIAKRLQMNNLFFYDLVKGKNRWKKSIGPLLGEPLIMGDRLYLATLRGRLLCLALADGALLAEARLAHDCLATPAMADGILAVGDDRGILHGFDAELHPLWQFDCGATLRAPAIASQGLFMVGSTNGLFSAVEIGSGVKRWQVQTSGKIFYAAAAADSTVVFSSTENRVYGVRHRDGEVLWQHDLAAVPTTSPLICGGTVFIGTANHRFLALRLGDGSEQWSFTAKGRINSAPVVLGRRIFFAAEPDLLYCFAFND